MNRLIAATAIIALTASTAYASNRPATPYEDDDSSEHESVKLSPAEKIEQQKKDFQSSLYCLAVDYANYINTPTANRSRQLAFQTKAVMEEYFFAHDSYLQEFRDQVESWKTKLESNAIATKLIEKMESIYQAWKDDTSDNNFATLQLYFSTLHEQSDRLTSIKQQIADWQTRLIRKQIIAKPKKDSAQEDEQAIPFLYFPEGNPTPGK